METKDFALGRNNLKWIGVAFAIILLGFILMLGESSTMENYNPDIFSFRRIVLAPGITFAGFVLMIWAIMKKRATKH